MGHPNYSRDADESKPAHISDSGWDAPQLGEALKFARAGAKAAFRTKLETEDPEGKSKITLSDFDAELPKLLAHMQERIDRGLAEAWLSDKGYGYSPNEGQNVQYDSLMDTTAFMDEPEERWARAFCEQFVFLMYHSPGQVYATSSNDGPYYNHFVKDGYFPISAACQNLSTFAVLTRGFPISSITAGTIGLSCSLGSCGFKEVFEQSKTLRKAQETPSSVPLPPAPAANADEETKKKYKVDLRAAQAAQQADLKEIGDRGDNRRTICNFATAPALVKAGFTPGSILVFNAGGVQYNGQNIENCPNGIANAHIATALRVNGQRIQFIDTGVVVGSQGEGGTSDHPFLTGQVNSPYTLIAAGVMKPVGKDVLRDFAKKTADAKPMGLARLVIVRTASGEVAFASKLLHMRWPLSRLIWSVRNLPVQGLTVAWFIYVPHGDGTVGEALLRSPDKPPSTVAGSGSLYLSNVIISQDAETGGGGVDIYRTRMWQNWRLDFSGNKIPIPKVVSAYSDTEAGTQWAPGKATDWKVAGDEPAPLWEWLPRPKNRSRRYVRKTLGGAVTIDEAKTGHPLVDPEG